MPVSSPSVSSAVSLPKRILPGLVLGALVVVGLYLRWTHLGSVQTFGGDQGTYYRVIMDWWQDGIWPLLGPRRGVYSDYSIGPGWYYTIAPALMLSGFNPMAGAMLIGLVGMAAVVLYWLWLRMAGGNQAAALALAAVLALSAKWVERDRILWNPYLIPLTVVALACLIEGVKRRPVACLGLFVMLMAIVPQWHTTGILALGAALPFFALAFWRAREQFGRASRKERVGWTLSVLVFIVLIYLPPVIYEFGPGPSNMRHYISRTMIPSPPPTAPVLPRLAQAADRLVCLVTRQTFSAKSPVAQGWPAWTLAGLTALSFVLVYGRAWRTASWRQVCLSPGYLATYVGGYLLVLFLKGSSVLEYFIYPVTVAPVLLAGWTTAELLGQKGKGMAVLARAGGCLMLGAGLLLTAQQFPQA